MRALTRNVQAIASAAVLGLLTGIAASPACAQVTRRVEPRPFYGATVSIEEGARVFRALPPHDQVIINPGFAAGIEFAGGDGALNYYAVPRNYYTIPRYRRGP
jgi:hypothetical protein